MALLFLVPRTPFQQTTQPPGLFQPPYPLRAGRASYTMVSAVVGTTGPMCLWGKVTAQCGYSRGRPCRAGHEPEHTQDEAWGSHCCLHLINGVEGSVPGLRPDWPGPSVRAPWVALPAAGKQKGCLCTLTHHQLWDGTHYAHRANRRLSLPTSSWLGPQWPTTSRRGRKGVAHAHQEAQMSTGYCAWPPKGDWDCWPGQAVAAHTQAPQRAATTGSWLRPIPPRPLSGAQQRRTPWPAPEHVLRARQPRMLPGTATGPHQVLQQQQRRPQRVKAEQQQRLHSLASRLKPNRNPSFCHGNPQSCLQQACKDWQHHSHPEWAGCTGMCA